MAFDEKFAREHWKLTAGIAALDIFSVIVGVFVFLWVAANAQATGLVPAMLGEWTVGYCITFIIHVIFWELLFVGTWTAVLAGATYAWARKFDRGKRKKRPRRKRDNGNPFGLFITLIWLAIVWTSGRWNLAFQSWAFNDWIYTWLYALAWGIGIVGIPAIIFFGWWLSGGKVDTKKKKR